MHAEGEWAMQADIVSKVQIPEEEWGGELGIICTCKELKSLTESIVCVQLNLP
jgi:hypothetical protein